MASRLFYSFLGKLLSSMSRGVRMKWHMAWLRKEVVCMTSSKEFIVTPAFVLDFFFFLHDLANLS